MIAAAGLSGGTAIAQEAPSDWKSAAGFFALIADDAQKIADWYVSKLNYKITRSGGSSQSLVKWFHLRREESMIEVLQPQKSKDDPPFLSDSQRRNLRGIQKIGFFVRDIGRLEADLTKREVDFAQHSLKPGAGFLIRDPEKNMIQFFPQEP